MTKLISLLLATLLIFTPAFSYAENQAQIPSVSTPTLFSDIKGHWAENIIEKYTAKGVIYGYPDRQFKASKSITELEFALLLERIFGYSAGYTNSAKNVPITRESAAALIYDVMEMQSDLQKHHSFHDEDQIAADHLSKIIYLSSKKIINGYPDKGFLPKGPLTRAEALCLIDNTSSYQEKQIKAALENGTYTPQKAIISISDPVDISPELKKIQNIYFQDMVQIHSGLSIQNVKLEKISCTPFSDEVSIIFNNTAINHLALKTLHKKNTMITFDSDSSLNILDLSGDLIIKSPHKMKIKELNVSSVKQSLTIPFIVEKLNIKDSSKVNIYDEKQILENNDSSSSNVQRIDSVTSATKKSPEGTGSGSGGSSPSPVNPSPNPTETVADYFKDEKNYGKWELSKENLQAQSTLKWSKNGDHSVEGYVSLKLVNTNAEFSYIALNPLQVDAASFATPSYIGKKNPFLLSRYLLGGNGFHKDYPFEIYIKDLDLLEKMHQNNEKIKEVRFGITGKKMDSSSELPLDISIITEGIIKGTNPKIAIEPRKNGEQDFYLSSKTSAPNRIVLESSILPQNDSWTNETVYIHNLLNEKVGKTPSKEFFAEENTPVKMVIASQDADPEYLKMLSENLKVTLNGKRIPKSSYTYDPKLFMLSLDKSVIRYEGKRSIEVKASPRKVFDHLSTFYIYPKSLENNSITLEDIKATSTLKWTAEGFVDGRVTLSLKEDQAVHFQGIDLEAFLADGLYTGMKIDNLEVSSDKKSLSFGVSGKSNIHNPEKELFFQIHTDRNILDGRFDQDIDKLKMNLAIQPKSSGQSMPIELLESSSRLAPVLFYQSLSNELSSGMIVNNLVARENHDLTFYIGSSNLYKEDYLHVKEMLKNKTAILMAGHYKVDYDYDPNKELLTLDKAAFSRETRLEDGGEIHDHVLIRLLAGKYRAFEGEIDVFPEDYSVDYINEKDLLVTNSLHWAEDGRLLGDVKLRIPSKKAVRFASEEIEEAIANHDLSMHMEADFLPSGLSPKLELSEENQVLTISFEGKTANSLHQCYFPRISIWEYIVKGAFYTRHQSFRASHFRLEPYILPLGTPMPEHFSVITPYKAEVQSNGKDEFNYRFEFNPKTKVKGTKVDIQLMDRVSALSENLFRQLENGTAILLNKENKIIEYTYEGAAENANPVPQLRVNKADITGEEASTFIQIKAFGHTMQRVNLEIKGTDFTPLIEISKEFPNEYSVNEIFDPKHYASVSLIEDTEKYPSGRNQRDLTYTVQISPSHHAEENGKYIFLQQGEYTVTYIATDVSENKTNQISKKIFLKDKNAAPIPTEFVFSEENPTYGYALTGADKPNVNFLHVKYSDGTIKKMNELPGKLEVRLNAHSKISGVSIPEGTQIEFPKDEHGRLRLNDQNEYYITVYYTEDGHTVSIDKDSRYDSAIQIYPNDTLSPQIHFEDGFQTQYFAGETMDIRKNLSVVLADEDSYLPFTHHLSETDPARKVIKVQISPSDGANLSENEIHFTKAGEYKVLYCIQDAGYETTHYVEKNISVLEKPLPLTTDQPVISEEADAAEKENPPTPPILLPKED